MKLSNPTFSIIPEGTHVFQIDAVVYSEEFGKMTVSMHVKNGLRHVEYFNLLKADQTPNNGALNAFSYFARCALNDFTVTDIDPQSLIGHYVKIEVRHEQGTNKDGQERTYTRLGNKYPAAGFEEDETAPVEPTAPAEPVPQSTGTDLDALLGL